MAAMEEHEFSSIYESVEGTDSDGDEYVTVSQPYPYMCPDPPPPTAGATWEGPSQNVKTKKPKLRQPLPSSGASNTTHLLSGHGAMHPHINPLPLPKRRGVGRGDTLPQKTIKYKKLGEVAAKPKRPPKPGYLSDNKSSQHTHRVAPVDYPSPPPLPQTPPPSNYPYHQLPVEHQFARGQPGTGHPGTEPANEYDSIKETRRMIAVRKKQQKMARERAELGECHGEGGGVQMVSRKNFEGEMESEESVEEVVFGSERGRRGQSRVVVILLSITMVSLVIAVASLALSLYSITAVHTRDCTQPIQCPADGPTTHTPSVPASPPTIPTPSTVRTTETVHTSATPFG